MKAERGWYVVALLPIVFFVTAVTLAQSYKTGKILNCDTNIKRNATVCYIQIENTTYQVTRGTGKPFTNLSSGQQVNFRIEKGHMFIRDETGKEVKYSIITTTTRAR
jgi:hypothetical protein